MKNELPCDEGALMMQCSYYNGFYDDAIKPKYGVSYMMLDFYIKDSVSKQVTKASGDLRKINADFKKVNEESLKALKSSVCNLSIGLTEIKKSILALAKENDLQVPEKKITRNSSKKSDKQKTKEENKNDDEKE